MSKRAIEYANQFNANPCVDTVAEIGVQFIREIAEIGKARGVKLLPGLVSILDEQNKKWAAFCRLTNGAVKEEGFEMVLQEVDKDLYLAWKMNKRAAGPARRSSHPKRGQNDGYG